MPSGTIKWFSNKKGYGFITPDSGGDDAFVHITAVQDAGLKFINEGQRVSYDIAERNDRKVVTNLSLLAQEETAADDATQNNEDTSDAS